MGSESRKRNWIGNRWWWPRLPFVCLLVFCGAWAYRPALDRVFFSDQLGYFAELHGETSLASGLRLIDYGVQRQYSRGDQLLYRPLLFAGLALENAGFKRDFRLWNAANLGMHLAVSYLLFEILWRIRRSLLACGFALWFALLASNFELVTWCHLGGYMLGYGLLLLALYARGRMDEENAGSGWCWTYGLAIAGAMLEHEIAVAVCVGLALHGLWFSARPPKSRTWPRIAALGAPLAIYGALYALHAFRCERLFWWYSSGGGRGSENLADLPALLLHWTQHVLLPRMDQLQCRVGERSAWLSWPGGMTSGGMAVVLLGTGLILCLRPGGTWRRQAPIWTFGNFLLILIVAYAGMNLLGRPGYVMQVPYYDYFPALFGSVWLYAHVDAAGVGRTGRNGALICLVLLALLNGWQVRQISEQIREIHRPWAHFLGWAERVVRPRLADRGFTFAVQNAPAELDLNGEVMVGFTDQNQKTGRHLFRVLYGQAFCPENPSEIFVYPGLGEAAQAALPVVERTHAE